MGRVRAKLADYYAGDGRANPDRLEFPKRSYVPTLRPAAPQGANIAPPATRPRRLWPAAALVAALCATAALPGVRSPRRAPRFEPRRGGAAGLRQSAILLEQAHARSAAHQPRPVPGSHPPVAPVRARLRRRSALLRRHGHQQPVPRGPGRQPGRRRRQCRNRSRPIRRRSPRRAGINRLRYPLGLENRRRRGSIAPSLSTPISPPPTSGAPSVFSIPAAPPRPASKSARRCNSIPSPCLCSPPTA
jgi:hypothetical protein